MAFPLGSLDPADLPRVAAPVLERRSELVLGARRPSAGEPGRCTLAWANRAPTLAIRRRTGCQLTDLVPMRTARREPLLDLGTEDRGFGWPLEMVLRAVDAGWRVTEVDVPYSPRTGRSKVTGTVARTARAVRDMARVLAHGGR